MEIKEVKNVTFATYFFKKIMKNLSLVFLLFINFSLFSQDVYFIDNDGTKTIIYEKKVSSNSDLNGDYGFGGYYLHYHNKEGKLKKIAQSKL